MTRLSGLRLLVAGSGAVGSAIALRLQRDGAEVVLADPAPIGDNASGVAAGMLAPAFEAALDPTSEGHFELLRGARDLWPSFMEALGPQRAELDRSGALWVADEAGLEAIQARLAAAGASAQRIGAEAARALSPGLMAPEGAVFTPEDWRIEAGPLLRAMRGAFLEAGGQIRPAAVRRVAAGEAVLADGEALTPDEVILATGLPPEGLEAPPSELGLISPVKGQIARFPGHGPAGGPVVRAEGVYVAPASAGALAGATMQAGVRDLRIEAGTIGRFARLAAGLFPALAGAQAQGAAGVRASTPDGLPLVGPSRTPRVRLALGARRNGWLLAPLIAEIIADQLAGRAPGPHAARLDPGRFPG